MYTIVEVKDPQSRTELCTAVLQNLPDWFGRPETNALYAQKVAGLISFASEIGGVPVGFAAIERTSTDAFDIHVMGLLRIHHGKGVGRALMAACEGYARSAGASVLTVKTIGPSSPDLLYAQTRAFYGACGMAALAEFPDHWGAGTPMLLMGKAL